jgi:DNA repair exonuclease SbcCD ATPase subunit
MNFAPSATCRISVALRRARAAARVAEIAPGPRNPRFGSGAAAIKFEGFFEMSERGRKLFDQYILSLLADAEILNSKLEAGVEALKAAAEAADIRVSEIEEEVGDLSGALANRLDLLAVSDLRNARLESRVSDLKTAADESDSRISKVEDEVEKLHDALEKR